MKRHQPLLSLVELCLVLALIHASSAAQTAAQINGRVTAANDAVVAGAQIRVSNAETGIMRTATANSEGYYVVPQLQPGVYQITVQRDGFRPVRRTDVTLEVAQTAEINFTNEVFNISTQAPLLETTTSNLGEVANSRTIESLPLNGRNVADLPQHAALVKSLSKQLRAGWQATLPGNGR